MELHKNQALAVVAKVIQLLIMMISLRVVTHILNPVEYGILAYSLLAASMVSMFIIYPVGMHINSLANRWHVSGIGRNLLSKYIAFILVAGVIAAIVTYVSITKSFPDYSTPFFLSAIVGVYLSFNTFVQTVIGISLLIGKNFLYVVISTSYVLAVLLSSMLSSYIYESTIGWMIGQALSAILFSIVIYKYVLSDIFEWKAAEQLGARISDGFNIMILFILGVATWISFQGFKLELPAYLDPYTFGLFSAGYGLAASIVGAYESFLAVTIQPALYKSSASDRSCLIHAWKTYNIRLFGSAVILVIIAAIFHRQIIFFLLAKNYEGSSVFFICGIFIELLRQFAANVILVYSLSGECKKLALLFFASSIAVFASFTLFGFEYPLQTILLCIASLVLVAYVKSYFDGYFIFRMKKCFTLNSCVVFMLIIYLISTAFFYVYKNSEWSLHDHAAINFMGVVLLIFYLFSNRHSLLAK